MALCDLKFFSEALGMQTEVYVVLPQRNRNGEIGNPAPEQKSGFKNLYLLHGLSDDHSIWLRRTCVERYADEYGIAVVMPCAAKSYYCDMKYGLNYYQFIAKELPVRMNEFFGLSLRREDNFVAGLSMGGYGALKIGLRECDRFCAAAGLSAAIDLERRAGTEVYKAIFGENGTVPEPDNLFRLAERCAADPNRPRLFLGCGTEDHLYPESVLFKEKLQALGYDLTYRESHGVHSWAFWEEYIPYVLEWMFG